MKTIHFYTDGACSGNPGPGGAAAIMISSQGNQHFWQGYKLTTNNRMELTAIILALNAAKNGAAEPGNKVVIHTDS